MAIDRRSFLVASATGYAGLRLGPPRSLLADERGVVPQQRSGRTSGGGKAKSVILFFLCGGASHIDTWDMKPDAPSEYRGPFSPIATASPEIRLCEHLPLLANIGTLDMYLDLMDPCSMIRFTTACYYWSSYCLLLLKQLLLATTGAATTACYYCIYI